MFYPTCSIESTHWSPAFLSLVAKSMVSLTRSSSPWGAVEDGCFFDVAEALSLVFRNPIEQSITLKMMIFDQSWCCWIIPTPIAGSVFGASVFCILEGHCPPFLMFESSKMIFIIVYHFNWDTDFALLEDTGAHTTILNWNGPFSWPGKVLPFLQNNSDITRPRHVEGKIAMSYTTLNILELLRNRTKCWMSLLSRHLLEGKCTCGTGRLAWKSGWLSGS